MITRADVSRAVTAIPVSPSSVPLGFRQLALSQEPSQELR